MPKRFGLEGALHGQADVARARTRTHTRSRSPPNGVLLRWQFRFGCVSAACFPSPRYGTEYQTEIEVCAPASVHISNMFQSNMAQFYCAFRSVLVEF